MGTLKVVHGAQGSAHCSRVQKIISKIDVKSQLSHVWVLIMQILVYAYVTLYNKLLIICAHPSCYVKQLVEKEKNQKKTICIDV